MIIDLLILTAIGLVIEAVSLIFQFRYGSSGFFIGIGENIYYYFPISITLVPVVIFIAIF